MSETRALPALTAGSGSPSLSRPFLSRPGLSRPFLSRPSLSRVVAGMAVLGAVLVASRATSGAAAAHAASLAGPELTRLLRGMALLKLGFAVPVTLAIGWRLGAPVTMTWLAGYEAAVAAMAAGPVLIWDMASVRSGALLLHGGLAAGVLLVWRDPATRALLDEAVRRRRYTLNRNSSTSPSRTT